jgi:hypothetical protein
MTDPTDDVLPNSPPPRCYLGVSKWFVDNTGHQWRLRVRCDIEYRGPAIESSATDRPGECRRFTDRPALLQAYEQLIRDLYSLLQHRPICSCGRSHEEPTT